MKELIKVLTLYFLLPLSITTYVLFNGYSEPLGLCIGIVCMTVGSVICVKGIKGC